MTVAPRAKRPSPNPTPDDADDTPPRRSASDDRTTDDEPDDDDDDELIELPKSSLLRRLREKDSRNRALKRRTTKAEETVETLQAELDRIQREGNSEVSILQEQLDAAIAKSNELQTALDETTTELRVERVERAVEREARGRFRNPLDALAFLDLDELGMDDNDGEVDPKALQKELKRILRERPYLAKGSQAPSDADGDDAENADDDSDDDNAPPSLPPGSPAPNGQGIVAEKDEGALTRFVKETVKRI